MTQQHLKLSVSSVDTFNSCKAKWFYRYVEKLPAPSNYYATSGKFIHKILEIYLRRYKKNGGDLRDAASVAYRLALRDEEIAPELTNEIRKEGMDWIKALTKKYEESPELIPTPLKIEASFTFKIEEENITVRGFIDRIDTISDKELLIVDYKTSKNPKYLKSFQLETYAYATQLKHPDKEIKAAYELIRYDFDRLGFEISPKSYEKVLSTFVTAGTSIRKLQEESPNTPWKPTISKLCSYCPFRLRCEQDRSPSPWEV